MPDPVQVAFKRIEQPQVGENGYVRCSRLGIIPSAARSLYLTFGVEIVVRDGVRLYVDVYRPANSSEKVPAVLSWSCYGKKYSALDMLPGCVWSCCVPKSALSGLEKFEGLDPQAWCPEGYAIVSVDQRGTGDSDGQICVMGPQDAEDGYDVVEAIARMDWCNGNVGMAGNSALAISQWFIAAQQPPSLKAIAPWEGMSDMYREQFVRGGWFSMSNFDLITQKIVRGPKNSGVEDWAEMYRRSPVQNSYWEGQRVDMKKIKCPAYIRGSDVSSIHTMGSIRGWMEIPHDKTWIHWSSKQEWYELYCEPQAKTELQSFFDRYLREEKNDWEKTPRVRWSALQFGDRPAVDDIVLKDFPVPGTNYRELYLHPGNKLSEEQGSSVNTTSYDSEDFQSVAEFSYTFKEPARLIGLPKAILYVSCDAKDDFTVFTILRKLGRDGKELAHLNFPIEATPVSSINEIPESERTSMTLWLGSVGILRASHRQIDASKSMHPQFPFHPHLKEEKVRPGTVVRLEIGIWAMGVDFDAGESISLRVGGQFPSIAEYKVFSDPRPEHELNRGQHKVHFGGQYPSSLILPFTPPR